MNKTQAESAAFRDALEKWLLENTQSLQVIDEGSCPTCDQWSTESFRLIACFDQKDNPAASMDSGPYDAEDWRELRQCDCGAFFVLECCNY